MREDDVAQTLGCHVALSTPAAETWCRVAHGELSADEAETCLVEGRQLGQRERSEIERAKQVFAPLSAEREREQLEGLLGVLGGKRAEEMRSTARVAAVPVAHEPDQATGARTVVAVLLAVAAAVVLVLWVASRRPPAEPIAFSGDYQIELEKLAATKRGAQPGPGELPKFLLNGEIKLRLVPEDAVMGEIGVVGFARGQAGEVRRLEIEPRVYELGVVEIDGQVRKLGLGEGEWELVLVIGRAGALPSSWEELGEGEDRGAVGYEVVRTRVEIVTRP